MGDLQGLIDAFLGGSKLALSRFLTYVEEDRPETVHIMRQLAPRMRHAHVIGITGPQGCGKSTLIDRLVRLYRAQGTEVAVITVDPSSPETGGAVLADRIRITSEDEGVFIRSMATRSHAGGVPRYIRKALDLLDAFGFGKILVETIGVGQDEIEIRYVAHTVVLVLTPETGDEVQTMKAGLMEVADIYAINKTDELPCRNLREAIEFLIARSPHLERRLVEISAKQGTNVDHLFHLIESHNWKGKRIGISPAESYLKEVLLDHFKNIMGKGYTSFLEELQKGEINAYEKIKDILGNGKAL